MYSRCFCWFPGPLTPSVVLCVREVRNFEWWEHSVAVEEVPAQDRVEEEPQQDCFGMSVVQ